MQEDPASQNLSTHDAFSLRIRTAVRKKASPKCLDQKTLAPCVFMYTSRFIRQNTIDPILVSCINRLTRILCRSSTEPSQQLCSVVPYLIEFTRVNSHSDSSKSNRCNKRQCEIKQLRSSHCHQELQFIMTRIFRVTRVKCSASLEKPQLMRNVRMQQHRNTLCPHGRQCKSTSQNCT